MINLGDHVVLFAVCLLLGAGAIAVATMQDTRTTASEYQYYEDNR